MSSELEARVRQVVVRVAKLPPEKQEVPPEADLFRDLGVESTAALDLLLSLEEEFNVSIPDDKFGDARTVRSLAALVGALIT